MNHSQQPKKQEEFNKEEEGILKRELQTSRFVKLMNSDINHKLDEIN